MLFIFKTGANSAFHEAVGDTITLAAMATQHRQRLGFHAPHGADQSQSSRVQSLKKIFNFVEKLIFFPIFFNFVEKVIFLNFFEKLIFSIS